MFSFYWLVRHRGPYSCLTCFFFHFIYFFLFLFVFLSFHTLYVTFNLFLSFFVCFTVSFIGASAMSFTSGPFIWYALVSCHLLISFFSFFSLSYTIKRGLLLRCDLKQVNLPLNRHWSGGGRRGHYPPPKFKFSLIKRFFFQKNISNVILYSSTLNPSPCATVSLKQYSICVNHGK